MTHHQLLGLAFIAVNLLSFALMGIDKSKARRHRRRISEKTLFVFPFLGGTLGAIAGMAFFRHKTKHKKFTLGLPALLAAQLALALFIYSKA